MNSRKTDRCFGEVVCSEHKRHADAFVAQNGRAAIWYELSMSEAGIQ
jgi:hypothetical protein